MDEFNQDYELYIHNQIKHNPKLIEEKERIQKLKELESLRLNLLVELVNNNVPSIIACLATNSNKKLCTFSAEDWINFSKQIRLFSLSEHHSVVSAFVQFFDDIKILTDEEKFKLFSSLYKESLPKEIIIDIMLDKISLDQARRAANLASTLNCSLKQAIEEIIKIDSIDNQNKELRKKYISLVHPNNEGEENKCLPFYLF